MTKQEPTTKDYEDYDRTYAKLCKQCECGAISETERDEQIILLNTEWNDKFGREE